MSKRRGFTLLELSVTLVLIALIGVTVASFTVMMRRRAESNRYKLTMLGEMEVVESTAEQWVESQIIAGESISEGSSLSSFPMQFETVKNPVVVTAVEEKTIAGKTQKLFFFTVTFTDESQAVFTVAYPALLARR